METRGSNFSFLFFLWLYIWFLFYNHLLVLHLEPVFADSLFFFGPFFGLSLRFFFFEVKKKESNKKLTRVAKVDLVNFSYYFFFFSREKQKLGVRKYSHKESP